MATGIPTNRTNIDLPVEMGNEILAKMQEQSAVMALSRHINLPGRGVEIPVILGDPVADWVSETGEKPVSNPNITAKTMRAYKLAVIVPFSNEFKRDAAALYDELVRRLPGALAAKFDTTVLTGTAPGSDFDVLSGATAVDISSDAYTGLVAADYNISAAGGVMNGIALSPQGRSNLLGSVDRDGRPLFINNVAEGAIPMVLGAKTVLSKGAYKAASGDDPAQVAVAGDWTQAMYGTVEGIKVDYSADATLNTGEDQINLFQRNMFAIRAEIEVGFVADVNCFNTITA